MTLDLLGTYVTGWVPGRINPIPSNYCLGNIESWLDKRAVVTDNVTFTLHLAVLVAIWCEVYEG